MAKPQQAKAKKKLASSLYTISGSKISRKNSPCPKCGAGVFMAQHKDRVSCGKCGYTEFSKKQG